MNSIEPDYSVCSYEELIDVRKKIDEEAFRKNHPKRYNRLLEEIEKKKIEPEESWEATVEIFSKHGAPKEYSKFQFNHKAFVFDLLFLPIIYAVLIYLVVRFSVFPIAGIIFGGILIIPEVMYLLQIFRFYKLNRGMKVDIEWRKKKIKIERFGRIRVFGFSDIKTHLSFYCPLHKLQWSGDGFTVTELNDGSVLILSHYMAVGELPARYTKIEKLRVFYPFPYQKQKIFRS